MNALAAPPPLRPGDGVSVVAPASSPQREAFDAALAGLEAAGFRAKTYRDVCQPHGYLAGTDAERADELNQAFADPDTTMVLAARGGYGVGRILDRVDFGLLKEHPKIVCGYSDITALHTAIQRHAGLVSFHGPNLIAGLGDPSGETASEREAAFAMFSGTATNNLLTPRNGDQVSLTKLGGGVAEGRLVGGNAAVLLSLLGTPFEPQFDQGILVLEDIGEAPYRVDRLLTQMRLRGDLGRVAGVVLGYFTGADADGGPSVPEVAEEFLAPLGVPVVVGAPFGHEHPNLPLPLGANVELDADGLALRPAQAVVA